MGYPLEVAAASRQGPVSRERCRCCGWAEVEGDRQSFGCEPGSDSRPRAPP
jgi:hypothetical protein